MFVTFQEGGDLSELRDAVLSVAALLLQLLQPVHELPAGQTGINTPQLLVNLPPVNTTHYYTLTILHHPYICIYNVQDSSFSPCGHFLCCVLHGGQRFPPETKTVNL